MSRCRCAELGYECPGCAYRISRAEDARTERDDDVREHDAHFARDLAPGRFQ